MNLQTIYRMKSKFVTRGVGNELVLVPLTGSVAHMNELFTLNETGCFIWENITEGMTIAKLEDLVVEEFDVEREIARKDIESFLDRLSQLFASNQ